MTTYSDLRRNAPVSSPASSGAPAAAADSQNAQGIAIDGVQQVIEMLRVADPAFRESILSRLAARDPAGDEDRHVADHRQNLLRKNGR